MNFNEYQELANKTANNELPYETKVMTAALGLCGEAGEVAEIIKKLFGHGHKPDYNQIVKELGDVLWYVSRLSYLLFHNLEEIATKNIEKLKTRYPEGFSSDKSINRVD